MILLVVKLVFNSKIIDIDPLFLKVHFIGAHSHFPGFKKACLLEQKE
ncbi:MAG: hypothetical protein HUK40_02655 [Desulfobacter sp.]|nr:hypothetical protein [Desulfobacter sp.]